MKVIYKYVLEVGEVNKFQIPRDRALAKVGRDPESGNPAIWFIVELTSPKVEARYLVLGTGKTIPGSMSHVGTAICNSFVWHVFRVE